MSQLPSIGELGINAQRNLDANESLRGLDMDHFLKLMITELQNQDPLNPLENNELLAQISQIREVGATERLTDTLDSVLLGQNVANATNLIGKHIRGIEDDGTRVEGLVERVTIVDNIPRVHVGQQQVGLNNVGEILPKVE